MGRRGEEQGHFPHDVLRYYEVEIAGETAVAHILIRLVLFPPELPVPELLTACTTMLDPIRTRGRSVSPPSPAFFGPSTALVDYFIKGT